MNPFNRRNKPINRIGKRFVALHKRLPPPGKRFNPQGKRMIPPVNWTGPAGKRPSGAAKGIISAALELSSRIEPGIRRGNVFGARASEPAALRQHGWLRSNLQPSPRRGDTLWRHGRDVIPLLVLAACCGLGGPRSRETQPLLDGCFSPSPSLSTQWQTRRSLPTASWFGMRDLNSTQAAGFPR